MKYSELSDPYIGKSVLTQTTNFSEITVERHNETPMQHVQFKSNWHNKEALGNAIYELIELYKSME